MSEPLNYFRPGEYIGDIHYGLGHIANKVEDRLGHPVSCHRTQLEIHSEAQREAVEKFLDATRELSGEGTGYLNTMLVAVGEHTGMYLYDGMYYGFVTF